MGETLLFPWRTPDLLSQRSGVSHHMRDLDLVCFTPKKDRPHLGVCQNRRGRSLSVASPGSRLEQRLGNRITGVAIPEPHGCRAAAHPANEPEPC